MEESSLIQVATMVFFSVWKTYLGPLIAAVSGFSYWQMLMINLGAALSSMSVALVLTEWWMRASRRRAGFNGRLRKALRFWKRYGNHGSLILAPVLLGIPTYTIVARRLKTSKRSIAVSVTIVAGLWCSLFYWAGREGFLLLEQV